MSETTATSDVTVQSVPSTKPPASVPQTKLFSVRLLVDSDGKGVPAFNQGLYQDKLPVQNAANSRTIQSSGCGLCAWTSLMAAAGCSIPTFTDANCTDFGETTEGAPPMNPSNFLKYFSDYALYKAPRPDKGPGGGWTDATRKAQAKKWANAHIFNDSESGVLRNDSPDVADAINTLVALNCPGAQPAFDNSQGGNGGATGTDIPGITSALEAGNPVILAVCFDSDSDPSHQVLAVGIAVVAGKTYYVINDSGFGNTDPFALLSRAGNNIGPITLGACTASPKRNPPNKDHGSAWGYGKIATYRVLAGLQQYTGVSLKPPPYSS